MPEVTGQDRRHQRGEVEHDEADRTEQLLHHAPEEIQGEHVEEQVHAIGMNETIGHQAVVLIAAGDRGWPQDESRHQRRFLPRQVRHHGGEGDDDDGHGHGWEIRWVVGDIMP